MRTIVQVDVTPIQVENVKIFLNSRYMGKSMEKKRIEEGPLPSVELPAPALRLESSFSCPSALAPASLLSSSREKPARKALKMS
jgi:hypothetical protein